jgi:GDP-4-dehydro-6-deoxy-D-mannose reductase
MPRAFISGASGFVGPWLCRALLADGWSVVAGTHGTTDETPRGIPEFDRKAVEWVPCDVRDGAALSRLVERSAPDAIFHLAGVSFVPAATADPGAAIEVNVSGAARLVSAVAALRAAGTIDPAVLVIGSGLQYGAHPPEKMPLKEDTPQEPRDVYAASKAAQEHLAMAAWRGEGVRVIATRSFNHSGPGQPPHFLLPRVVREALALRESGGDTMTIGNIDSVRDFLHVDDVVRAYVALARHGKPGEAYNVASGTGLRVEEAVTRVLALAGARARLNVTPALQRAVDVPVLVGDSSKLRAATGWAPQHTFDNIIEDLIRAASR